MAKIGALQVDTLNILPGAITATAVGNPVGVANPAGLPIEVHGTCTIQYNGVSSASNGQATYRIRRSRDGAILFEEAYSFNGNNAGTALVNASILDYQATTSETYYTETPTTYNPGTPGGTGGLTQTPSALHAISVKK